MHYSAWSFIIDLHIFILVHTYMIFDGGWLIWHDQSIRRTECKLQQAEQVTRHNRVRADKPEEAVSELQQAGFSSKLDLTPNISEGSWCTLELPKGTSGGPREPGEPWDSECEPELPLLGNPPLFHRAPLVPPRTWPQLQQHQDLASLHWLPQEPQEAKCWREPFGVSLNGGGGAGTACGDGVPAP